MSNHDRFYDEARYYDIAFDFKDVASECAVIRALAERCLGRPATSFLECAAGPALHAIEEARHGLVSHAIDLSEAMVAYGLEKARAATVSIDYQQADMTDFTLAAPVDCAAILMDSTSYLLDNDAVLAHLDCMAQALVPGGMYLLEMGHPRDVFGVGTSAGTDWTMTRGDVIVHTQWGHADDPFDPTTQVTKTSVRLAYTDGDDKGEIVDTAPQRAFTANEFLALVRASAAFDVVDILGAMDEAVPFSNEKAAWRFIPVLKRRSR